MNEAARGRSRRRILLGVWSGWGAQVVSLAVGVLTLPMFFRYLERDELGIWMFFLGTSAFVYLADLGFSPVLSRHLAFELGRGDGEARESRDGSSYYYSLSRLVSRISAPALLVGMVIAGYLFIRSLGLDADLGNRASLAWVVFCLSQAVACLSKYLETTLNGHGEVGWQTMVEVPLQIGTLAGFFLSLSLSRSGITGLALVFLARSILNAGMMWYIVRRRIPPEHRQKVVVSWRDVKPHVRPAADMFLISFGAFLVLNTDQYFIVRNLGPEALPDYAAAYRLVQVAFTFAATASAVSAPHVSRLSAAGDRVGVHRLLLINTTLGMMILLAAVSVIAVFGDHLLQLWLGPGHFVGWRVLWVFCTMLTLENHHVIFARIGLNAKTDPSWGWMSMLSGLLNLVFSYVGVRALGLLGVAAATMAAQMLTNNWYAVWKTLRIVKMSFTEYLTASGSMWIGAGCALLAAMAGVRALAVGPLFSLGLAAAVVVLLYSGLYLRVLRREWN